MRKYFIVILMLTCFGIAQAQVPMTSLRLLTRTLPDSILLRWAPINYDGWAAGNKYGYHVVRVTIMRNGKLQSKPQIEALTAEPIKPWALNRWEALADSDKYMSIAAQAIYGETFAVSMGKNTNFLEIVNKVREQESRFSFALFCADQSSNAAKASGLWFTDRHVKKNEKYVYRVFLAAPQTVVQSDTAYSYTGVDEYLPLPKPLRLTAEFGNKGVVLHWDRKTLASIYNSYQLERSEDSIHFVPLSNERMVSVMNEDENEPEEMIHIDSLISNNKTYYYRLFGFSAFGEKSPASNVVKGRGMAELQFAPEIISKEEQQGKFLLKWDYKDDISNIKGFRVYRSLNHDIGFDSISPLLKPNVRSFVDDNPLPTNYYRVMVIGRNGDIKNSFPSLAQLADSTPPAPPVGLKAVADTSGRLILSWQANKESDIKGYRVYRGNAANEEFSQLTVAAIADTFFIDTINLKTTTRTIYYQLMAIDKRQNHSLFSEVLEVERPDIVPPAPAAIINLRSTSEGVFLQWANSSSSDVVEHLILRKLKEEPTFTTILRIPITDTLHSVIDTSAQVNQIYYYTIKALDKAGLLSQAAPQVAAQRMAMVEHVALNKLKLVADRKLACITLTWDAPNQPVASYIIYRQAGEKGALVTYGATNGSKPIFTDIKIQPDTQYSYMVEAVMKDGSYRISKVEKVDY
jgi:fibronectin type 3 domain-containing protein